MGVASPVTAQVTFSRCLSQAEALTEQLVRHGVFLREAGNRCVDYNSATAKLWKDFDTKFGVRMKQQTDKRTKLFTRQFKDKAVQVTTYFDGRLVTYHRHYPLSASYCGHVEDLLKEANKRGWAGFTDQAKTVQNEVLMDYKVCQ
jgi:hypothetical protein